MKFATLLVMYMCRKMLLINVDINWKVGFYVCGVTVVSLFTDLFRFPDTYFSNKRNVLNVYFVKWGWAWTLALLSTFIYLVGLVDCTGNVKDVVKKHFSRLFVGTLWWYICISLMNAIEHVTGFCYKSEGIQTKAHCITEGFEWRSWDPSGHCFLLVYCLLIISEEMKCITLWDRIPEIIENRERNLGQIFPEKEKTIAIKLHTLHTPILRCVVIALALLNLLWQVMLLATTIYFHNMPSKLMGVTLAAVGWLMSYNFWFQFSSFIPSYPGFRNLFHLKDN